MQEIKFSFSTHFNPLHFVCGMIIFYHMTIRGKLVIAAYCYAEDKIFPHNDAQKILGLSTIDLEKNGAQKSHALVPLS